MLELPDVAGQALIGLPYQGHRLLRRNLTADGILAASPGDRAKIGGYTAIFGRYTAICAIGRTKPGGTTMAASGRGSAGSG